MKLDLHSCIRCVGGTKTCARCGKNLIGHGRSRNGKARFKCKNCKITQVEHYSYNAYAPYTDGHIIKLTKEGMGIRSTARFLDISTITLLKRIFQIANGLKLPMIAKNKVYELRTFVKRKDSLVWIVCAYVRESKSVVSFSIGARTNKTLEAVLKTLKYGNAVKIFTDGLKNYRYLIDKAVYCVKRYATNPHLAQVDSSASVPFVI